VWVGLHHDGGEGWDVRAAGKTSAVIEDVGAVCSCVACGCAGVMRGLVVIFFLMLHLALCTCSTCFCFTGGRIRALAELGLARR
jgi:hypothetical protein